MPKSKLLMLTHRFPFPLNRGDRIRSYNLLRYLSDHFDVTLASYADEPVSLIHRRHIESFCKPVVVSQPGRMRRLTNAAKSVLLKKSITEGMFNSDELYRNIRQLHSDQPFEHVVVFCSSMFPYVSNVDFDDVRMIVDLVDVDSLKWEQLSQLSSVPRSWVFGREASCVRELEERIVQRAEAVTLVSSDETEIFRDRIKTSSGCKIVALPNGVDTEYFSPTEFASKRLRRSSINGMVRLVFTGVLNYLPNVEGLQWFCQDVLPAIQATKKVGLKIVGRSADSRVQSLGRLSGVEVVGEVPDVRPYLNEAHISVSPLKLARGVQNKVLEAMSIGCPVICTTPAAQGIEGADGLHFLVADSVDQWCEAIMRLANDDSLRQSITERGQALTRNQYSWNARLRPIVGLIENQISKSVVHAG